MTSQEILDFMLGKKGGGGGEGKSNTHEAITLLQTPTSTPKSATKKVRSVAAAFAKCMADWLDTDDTAYEVMQSIANLRERIWHISKQLASMKLSAKQAEWKRNGYRNIDDDNELLNIDDLELALHHDVLQHERMLTSLRKILSAMAQEQEALGRRLDEFYKLDEANTQTIQVSFLSLEDCQVLFTATASELYRKQIMTEKVLNSVDDRLLYREDADDDGSSVIDESPRRLAQRCSEHWSRTHKDCCLLEFADVLKKLEQSNAQQSASTST